MPAKNQRKAPYDRAMDKVAVDELSGCWVWQARVSSTGCPLIWIHERDTDVSAARVIYETRVGVIPAGLRLWHSCGNRRCVNPAHMVPTTVYLAMMRSERSPSVLNRRKTHCPHGHPYETAPSGNRICAICRRERSRLAMRRKYVPASLRRAGAEDAAKLSA